MEVRWTRKAFEQMNQIIQLHPARKDEVADALQEVTARLQAHGMTVGESRGGNLRVYVAGPLTAFYVTDEEANTAEIIRVRARFRA